MGGAQQCGAAREGHLTNCGFCNCAAHDVKWRKDAPKRGRLKAESAEQWGWRCLKLC